MHTAAGSDPEHQRATVDRRIIGGITLYPQQITKLDHFAKSQGISRSAAIRQLIDQHL
jgi:hypothetical protein